MVKINVLRTKHNGCKLPLLIPMMAIKKNVLNYKPNLIKVAAELYL